MLFGEVHGIRCQGREVLRIAQDAGLRSSNCRKAPAAAEWVLIFDRRNIAFFIHITQVKSLRQIFPSPDCFSLCRFLCVIERITRRISKLVCDLRGDLIALGVPGVLLCSRTVCRLRRNQHACNYARCCNYQCYKFVWFLFHFRLSHAPFCICRQNQKRMP